MGCQGVTTWKLPDGFKHLRSFIHAIGECGESPGFLKWSLQISANVILEDLGSSYLLGPFPEGLFWTEFEIPSVLETTQRTWPVPQSVGVWEAFMGSTALRRKQAEGAGCFLTGLQWSWQGLL